MKSLFVFFCLIVVTIIAKAQTSFELQNNSGGTYTMNMYYGADPVIRGVPYDKIKGKPFLYDEWMSAALYDYANKLIGRMPILMNIATGEIYFSDSSEIKVADEDIVRKIVVYTSPQSNEIKAVFLNFIPYLYYKGDKINDFVQIFHTGPTILLKYRKKELSISEGGGGMPKYYFFKETSVYYFQVSQKIERIRRLTKEHIFQLLPGANAMESWVDENKINFRNEADLIKFIEYYNSVKEKAKN